MHGKSGIELQRQLVEAGRHFAIVFLIAHEEDQRDRRTTLQAGAMSFARKPFDDQVLLDIVQNSLSTEST